MKRLLELKAKLNTMPSLKPIDGWMGFTLNSDGDIMAGKWTEDGVSMVSKFKPEGAWKEAAEKLKVQIEFQQLFGSVTEEEFQEYLKKRPIL